MAGTDYEPRLSPLNIERVYRGFPAYAPGGGLPGDALSPRELEVASRAAIGLSYEEISEAIGGLSISTVRTHLHAAYRTLEVDSKIGLGIYFPITPESESVRGKRLAQLGRHSVALEVLEGLSQGLVYKQVASQRYISVSTVRTHIHNIGETWPDTRNGTIALQIVNALRARYIEAVEEHDYGLYEDIAQLTLPFLAEIEDEVIAKYGLEKPRDSED